jgi:outer membrane translocation and assembly module TamA
MGQPFSVVGFFDAGNVFRLASDLDLGKLRGSAGLGFRWDSPIGPLRLDLGHKLSRDFYRNGRRESGLEWHFSLGQTF